MALAKLTPVLMKHGHSFSNDNERQCSVSWGLTSSPGKGAGEWHFEVPSRYKIVIVNTLKLMSCNKVYILIIWHKLIILHYYLEFSCILF